MKSKVQLLRSAWVAMAIGLYIHVPFCVRKCLYCDFTSYPYHPLDDQTYLQALRQEMHLYGKILSSEEWEVSSLYIGGGTPHLPAGRRACSHH